MTFVPTAHIGMASKPPLLVAVLFVLSFGASTAHAQVSCGDTITSDVTLTGTLDCSAGTHSGAILTIAADGVTLDGGGNTIKGIYRGGTGVFIIKPGGTPINNVTVRNIVLEGSRNPLLTQNAHDVTIEDVTIPDPLSNTFGLQHGGGDRLTLTNNNFSSRNKALYIFGGDGHNWSGNTFESAGASVMNRVFSLTNGTFTNNTFSGPFLSNGFWLYNSSNNTFTENTFTAHYIALWLDGGSSNNTFTDNNIQDAGRRWGALYITGGSANNTFSHNNYKNNNGRHIQNNGGGANFLNLPAPDGGNWYDSHPCSNPDADAFCNNAYVGVGPNATDFLPLANEVVPGPADTDGDGYNDDVDNCPQIANPGQEDLDNDGTGDVCDDDRDGDGTDNDDDAFPDDPNEDTDSDGDGVGDNGDAFPNDPNESSDGDTDGVGDNSDMCAATSFPDNVGTSKLNPNHWRVDSADNFTFEQGKTKKGKGGSGGSYTMADTAGCTCEQIIVELDLGKGHVKHGCSNSAMADWVAFVNGHGNKVASQATLNASFDDEFELNAGQLPTEFDLLAAYPNPFNPQTTISFTMPESAEVHLAVYDLLGREVAMLVNGVLEAGTHQARFDAGELPSGGYIYRLTTPQGEFTKMMMLMK